MIRRNIPLFKLTQFLGGLWFLASLAIVYFENITHSYALAMAVFAVSSLSTTLLEIPAGLISDKIGRRKTLLFSPALIFLGFLLWALAGTFELSFLLFIGAFLYGTAEAFKSGTDEALIYETMDELNERENFKVQYAKSRGWGQIGLTAGAVMAAVITYFYSLQVLAWVSLIPFACQFMAVWFYIEPQCTQKSKKANSWVNFKLAFKNLWQNKKLRFYACIEMIDNAFGMATFRFEGAYYQTLISQWGVNIVRFLKHILGIIGFFIAPYFRKISVVKLFFSAMIGNAFVRLLGVILNNAFSPFIMATVSLFYGTEKTSCADIMQQEFSSEQRATMKSIISCLSSIFMAFVLILMGWIADIYGARTAILIAILVKIVVIIASLVILNKKKFDKR